LETAPASYTISTHIDNDSFQYQLTDSVPCLDDLAGTVYGPSGSVCAHPAFHVLGVTIAFTGTVPGAGYLPRYVDIAGDQHDMQVQSNAGTRVGWVIPQADIGRVAALIIPRDADQQDHHNDRVQVLGYADPSLARGDTLRNAVSADWYVGDAADPYDATPQRATADLHILDDAQVGITKKMGDVGAVTGGQATLDLAATLLVPHAADHDLVISDLLPPGTRLATDPAAITGTLSWKGQPAPSSTTPTLQATVTPDYAGGQELLKIVLPAAELPAEAGSFTLTIGQLRVDKPSDPGVYTNTARVFYDDPDLLPACAAGQYSSLDPAGSRDDPAASPANCSADATFRTATSASGQFELVKTVQGDYDSAPQTFPNVAHVKLQDGTAQYAIQWSNSGAPTLDGVVIYDVFPHVGDTGVSGAQANSQRGSQFAPVLASIDPAPSGTALAYSASENPCRPEVYPGQPTGCVDDWTTDPATLGGLGAVTAIRLTASGEYATGDSISLGFRASVPTVSADQIAWNSVAAFARTSSGTALLPSESPKVGITASDHRLAIAKTADAASAQPGDAVHYTVSVSNLGTSDSDPTTAHDRLPAGLTFVSADRGGSYDAATGEVTWPVPAIPRGSHVDLAVTARVDAVQTRSTITNAATVTLPPGYSPTIVDGACAADPAAACADLGVPVTPSRLPVTGIVAPAGAVLLALLAIGAGLVLRRRRAATRS
ncbi:MAG TPA: DUF11 domain-containing protein, partial [Pseudolysinimonas sp.]|nr:DUF11 domain-containing protein [Pseudolysinimonas sp.]